MIAGGLEWGDVPTWVVAIGTLSAVIVALWVAGRDERRRLTLEEQHQAEKITAWLEAEESPRQDESGLMYLRLVVDNGSPQLVYEVIASLVAIQGAYRRDAKDDDHRFRTYVGRVPPGRLETRLPYAGHGMYIRFGVEIAFRDTAGRRWRRLGDGRLEEIHEDPADFYSVPRPIDWQQP